MVIINTSGSSSNTSMMCGGVGNKMVVWSRSSLARNVVVWTFVAMMAVMPFLGGNVPIMRIRTTPLLHCEQQPSAATLPPLPPPPGADTVGPNTSPKVICMGLPKTSTTSVAVAFQELGYKAAHHKGDKLKKSKMGCQVISNTMERKYRLLDTRHPHATWVIMYAHNASQWTDSFIKHELAKPRPYFVIRMDHDTIGLDWALFADAFPAMNRTNRETPLVDLVPEEKVRAVMVQHKEDYIEAYNSYYRELFGYFESKGKLANISIIDTRSGDGYEKLYSIARNRSGALIDTSVPFPHANSADDRGGFPKCK